MSKTVSVRFVFTVALLAGTTLAAALSERRIPDYLAAPLENIDRRILGWEAVKDEQLTPDVLQKLDPTSYLSRTYTKENVPLGLFIAFYAQQRAGESMHSPKHCLPGSGWEIWKQDSALVPFHGRPVQINKYSISNSGQRMLMFYWYQSNDQIVASEFVGKLFLVRDALLTGRTAGSIVRIVLPDNTWAAGQGEQFAKELMPRVQLCFRKS